jgi:hypothetical protein
MKQHMIRCTILATAFFVSQNAIAAPFAKKAKGSVKVSILAGQSNLEGQSVVDLAGKDYNDGKGTHATLIKDPAKASLFKHLQDSKGNWAERDDVWVRYQREKSALLAGPLKCGYSVYGDPHPFGSELQFGHVIGDAIDNQVLLVKTAWGGKSLDVDFRPPSSGGTVGPYHTLIDVILETGGKMFNEDARKSIARTIQEAEKEENKGPLKLTI